MAQERADLLIGDIGGTRTRLRVLARAGSGWRTVHELRRPTREFRSLDCALDRCLSELTPDRRRRIGAAVLAVAGPVRDGRVRFTNLPWEADEVGLAAGLGLPAVRLVNDLEALAHGLESLPEESFVTLKGKAPGGGRSAVIAVGTGLGVALRCDVDGGLRVFGSEGGHADFAPADEEQVRVLRWLRRQHGHVSYERVLSGLGLSLLYEHACRHHGVGFARRFVEAGDPAAAVTALAAGGDPRALAAVSLFIRVLGAFAGNTALQWPAGGVYLTGGVLPHLREHLLTQEFRAAFGAKGRLSPMVETAPVALVDDVDAGLAGALRLAESLGRPAAPAPAK